MADAAQMADDARLQRLWDRLQATGLSSKMHGHKVREHGARLDRRACPGLGAGQPAQFAAHPRRVLARARARAHVERRAE